ncbi:hypothetical protein GVAV_002914 [Gurleya vavrai]
MTLVLEKEGTRRSTLDLSLFEPFTRKQWSSLIEFNHKNCHDYYICRVLISEYSYTYYDARQLCKYIFEMQISNTCRNIVVRNHKDPVSQSKFQEINFFRIAYDSETPMRADFIGDENDFLRSLSFRTKLFYSEDPDFALNVNFCGTDERLNFFARKKVFSFFVTIIFIIAIAVFLLILLEKAPSMKPEQPNLPQKFR